MRLFHLYIPILGIIGSLVSCKKDNQTTTPPPVTPPTGYQLAYDDSVYYINDQRDYTIRPVQNASGEYSGYPEGIDIDSKTGEIRINKSETGLRYRVSFVPSGSIDSFHTDLVISGINFLDGFYKLTTTDSVLRPLYNGRSNAVVPGIHTGTVFDDGSSCNSAGCNVNTENGTINLAQTVRNGVFGSTPSNNDRHEFDLNYRISDKSGKALNTLKVKLYYFATISDVTPEAYDIISSREGAIFGMSAKMVPFQNRTTVNNLEQHAVFGKAVPKPRPPCIFIIGR